ncbi:GSCOCG00005283001-RA-CDS, partial [Cotesia congregata]
YVKETPNIIKLDVRSWHLNSKTYHVYIRHYCDCPNGNRTVECCAHVVSVIYYLAHGRYLSRIIRPVEILL